MTVPPGQASGRAPQPARGGAACFWTALVFILAQLIVTRLISAQPVSGGPSDSQDAVMRAVHLQVKGGKIEIALPQEPIQVSSQELLHWVKSAADAVSMYYGRFPVPHLTLQIRTGPGAGIRHGVTYPKDGGLIFITVGRETTVEELGDDWTLTHEMVHLAFPSMADNHHWIEEGISTYVEPVARAQAGQLSAADGVWKQFIRDMPKGQPAAGDQGLDHTPTWGRTYWGGAMFCLIADLRIRERTGNRKGLQDALRAIMHHGGTIAEDWDIEKALSIGDQATGTSVLENLYQEMRDKPVVVDLDQMWRKLGVQLEDREVTLNDKAADATIRQAITASK